MGQGGPVAGLAGEAHGLVAPLPSVGRRGEVGRGDRVPREQSRAQLGVICAEQGQRLVQQPELAVVPEPHLEAAGVGPHAERGQREQVGTSEIAREVGRPRERVARGLPVATVQVRVAQCEQQVCLLLGLRTRGDGTLELLRGRLVGARRHRVPGRVLRGQHTARRRTTGSGAQLMVGDGRPAHVLLAPADGQCVSHPGMERLALPARELRDEGGPDQRVGELVLGPVDRVGQPRPGRLLQQPGDHVDPDPAHLAQQRRVEAVPDDGGRPQQLVAGLGEPGQSSVEHRPHAGRQRQRPARGQLVALGLEQPGDVEDEERVAAGVVTDAGRTGDGLSAAGTARATRTAHLVEQGGDVVGAQSRQGERLAAGAGLSQQVPQRVVASDLGVAIAAEDQHAGGAELLDDEGQQSDRGGVGPLEVVGHQHQRPGRCGSPQSRGHPVEEHEPVLLERPLLLASQLVCDRGRLCVTDPGQQADDGPEGRHRVVLHARGPREREATRACLGGHGPKDGRLADAGLTGEQHQATAARPGGLECRRTGGEDQVAAERTMPDRGVTRWPIALTPVLPLTVPRRLAGLRARFQGAGAVWPDGGETGGREV